jgi:hypothetical protein
MERVIAFFVVAGMLLIVIAAVTDAEWPITLIVGTILIVALLGYTLKFVLTFVSAIRVLFKKRKEQ